MHAAGAAMVAGLGGGSAIGGAAGAAIASIAANNLNRLSDGIADSAGGSDAAAALGNIVSNVIATGAGGVIAGNSGASSASNADRYNNQRHKKVDDRPGHENTAGNDVTDTHLNILPTAGGAISGDAQPETFTVGGGGAMPMPSASDDAPKAPIFNPDGAARAAKNGSNWSSGSLSDTVTRIAGSSPTVSYTDSGKTIYTNPNTGAAVVYDNAGNYYRVQNASG
ncbi:hypothetical protein [Caballeronia ptereochthonis]|uniref:Filamentous hemagglutinin outer membrane protein n=1 Tax=Caballeronia ptereochthonis TaxID=1777144 RepID=A0A158EBN8_9BURK|nr:hypothetical protein [Caballeronia ptereochthonis]SAL04299.1 hypothetical protein AWB83_07004 [Caballeronia ptereochthonis]